MAVSTSTPRTQVRIKRTLDGSTIIEGGVASALDTLKNGERDVGQVGGPELAPGQFGTIVEMTETSAGFTKTSAAELLEFDKTKRGHGSIPTADLIKHTSFKEGSKLIISIQPEGSDKVSDGLFFESFSLQSISQPREEKYQIHETFFGEKWFLFGQRPRIWSIQGTVLNAKGDMSFADELSNKYESHYRGTKALEQNFHVIMTFEDETIEAVLLNFVPSKNSTMPSEVSISITFGVIHHDISSEFLDSEELIDMVDANLASLRAAADPVNGSIAPAAPGIAQIEDDARVTAAADEVARGELTATQTEAETLARITEEARGAFFDAVLAKVAAKEELDAAIDSGDQDEIGIKQQELALAQAVAQKAEARTQELEAQRVTTDEAMLARTLKSEVTGQVKDNAQGVLDLTRSESATAARAADPVLEDGGVISSSEFVGVVDPATGSASRYAVVIEYKDGKPSNRSVKKQTITVLVPAA